MLFSKLFLNIRGVLCNDTKHLKFGSTKTVQFVSGDAGH